jgi:hypothetical protein
MNIQLVSHRKHVKSPLQRVADYCENHMKHTNTVSMMQYGKAGGMSKNHWTLSD